MTAKVSVIKFQTFFILFLHCFMGCSVEGLHCYECLSLDCSDDDKECNQVRTFLLSQLRDYYNFNESQGLDPCPKLNETEDWRETHFSNESCQDLESHRPMCTLGRIRIKSVDKGPFGMTEDFRYNYATILGCANDHLLDRINLAALKGLCDYDDHRTTDTFRGRVDHYLQIEHCPDPKTWCSHRDYCTDLTRRVETEWILYFIGYTSQDYQLRFATLIVIMIGIVGICIGFYKDPDGKSLTCLRLVERKRPRPRPPRPVEVTVEETTV